MSKCAINDCIEPSVGIMEWPDIYTRVELCENHADRVGAKVKARERLLNSYYREVPTSPDGIARRAAMVADIDAIEREAVAAELADLRAAIEGLFDETNDTVFGPDEFWVDSEPYVRAYAVLQLIAGVRWR